MPPRAQCFVDMPFGRKTDRATGVEVDFDRIYALAIRPAILDAGLDPLRGDEERAGGIIHAAMFARLLLAEYVVADLTLGNPNVFYELGIRHAAKPSTTVPIYAAVNALPFDVSLVRAIGYRLDAGELTDDAAAALRQALAKRLRDAAQGSATDSPIFQLLPAYPGIDLPFEASQAFAERLGEEQGFRDQLRAARGLGSQADRRAALRAIENGLDLATTPHSVLADLLLSYRAAEAWPEMVSLCERSPEGLRQTRVVRQRWALALNRRRLDGDREHAVRILEALLDERGADPETLGILGRVHKDRYTEAKARGDIIAEAALDDAIAAYTKGFETDPRDYYPGINAITLLIEKGDDDAMREVERLRAAVAFAADRSGGLNAKDYWVVATVLELACGRGDWPTAARALPRTIAAADEAFKPDTTADNLALLGRAWARQGLPSDPLDPIIAELRKRAQALRGGGEGTRSAS